MLKKFFKWSGIVAGIMLAVGLIILFATTVMGGKQLLTKLSRISITSEMWDELGVDFEWDEAGDAKSSYLTSEVNSLNLTLGAGELIVQEKDTDDGKIDISISGVGNCKHYVDDEGTLVVEGFNGSFGIGNSSVNKIVLEVPQGMTFVEVDVVAGAGKIELSDIQVSDFDAEIGAGQLNLSRVIATEFSTTIGAGQMEAEEMDLQDAEISVSMGECIFQGNIKGNLEAECDMGNMDLELAGSQQEHNFEIECGAGNVDMDGFKMTGLSGERTIDNGAVSEYEITCNLGNITVEFDAD